MLNLRTLLLQIALGGALSAAAAVVWIMQAVALGLRWFDRMAQQGLADLALIVISGTAVGLTVWLCGRGPRSRWLVAAWAVAGMLVLHFLIMSFVPRDFDSGPVDVFTVLWTWPWLSIAAFLPLAAALTSYWMSVVKLVVLAQIVIAGSMSVYLALMLGMGLAEGPDRSGVLPFSLLGGAVIGLVVWLLGLMASSFAENITLASFVRLLKAIVLSILGFIVSQLMIDIGLRSGGNVVLVPLHFAALFTPLVGALAGYWYRHRRPA